MQREWEEKYATMTEEELKEIEEQIPEWKQGALVLASDSEEEEEAHRGLIARAKQRISESEAVQNFKESEPGQKLSEARKEYQTFKTELKEQMDASASPAVQGISMVADKAFSETAQA